MDFFLSIFFLIAGTAIAVLITFIHAGVENPGTIYVFICGIVAICSMLLPGLSGSFILIIMGNYLLILSAVSAFDMNILIPFVAGCAIGLVVFSRLLSWVLRRYHDQTISLLTGFILGSLYFLWPWKTPDYLLDQLGNLMLKDGEPIIVKYIYQLPGSIDADTILAVGLMIIGFLLIWLIDKVSVSHGSKKSAT